MKLRILGSGGGEGFPAPFCSCAHCEAARALGGKSLRTLSQSIVNDDLLIDFPADTNAHCLRFGLNLGRLQHILITHPHRDHFQPDLLSMRGGIFAHHLKYPDLDLYGPPKLEELCRETEMEESIRAHIRIIPLSGGQTRQIGDYEVTALPARHAPELGSLNYIIEQGGKRLLYLIDSGYPTEETLDFLQAAGKPFDLVVMDGTMGISPPKSYLYHMGYQENILLKEELLRRGLADPKTRFIVTHITHNKSEHHQKVEEIFKGTDIAVAFDGLETEV